MFLVCIYFSSSIYFCLVYLKKFQGLLCYYVVKIKVIKYIISENNNKSKYNTINVSTWIS